MNYDNRMSIVVVSCDAYQDIAEHYVSFLRLNWPDCRNKLLIGMEEKIVSGIDVNTIVCGRNSTWTERAIKAINKANTPYIMLSVEDLFISKPVNDQEINIALDFIENENIKYYRIPVFKLKNKKEVTHPTNGNVELIAKNERYNVSIGTAIWEKNELLKILGDGNKSAWDVENYFLERANESGSGYFDNYVSDKRFLLNTVHMIKSGKWIPKSTRIISKLGYEINFLERGYISFSDRIKLNGLYSWASRRLPVKLRRIIKKIMSFFGFHFASKS